MIGRNISEGIDQYDLDLVEKIFKQLQYFSLVDESYAEQINPILELIKTKDIVNLRNRLRALLNLPDMNNPDNNEIRLLAKVVHTLSLILAKYFPLNKFDDQGLMRCEISYAEILPGSRLLLGANGYQIDSDFAASDRKEGDRDNPYHHLYADQAENEFKAPIDKNRTEIEYLKARLEAIHSSSGEPEIPNVPDAKEFVPTLVSRRVSNKIAFGTGSLGIFAGTVSSYYLFEDSISFKNSYDYPVSILLILFIAVLGGASGLMTISFVNHLVNGINKLSAAIQREDGISNPHNFKRDAINFFAPSGTPAVALDIQEISAPSDNKAANNNDLTVSLLGNHADSNEEKERNTQQQFYLLSSPLLSRRTADGIEMEYSALKN